ncbi:MAG: DNA polymerase III subunit delta [Prevotella sp.]|nr:DNA polymerase III subunit delta [Prevotella sp.]
MKFSEVIGQDDVKSRLMQMVSENRVPHALMLCGSGGSGILALALAFASYLLGQREEGTPAHVEAMINTFQHPDLHFVFPVVRPPKTPSDKKITSDDFLRQWTTLLTETAYFSFEEWLDRINAGNQQAQIFAAEGDVLAHKLSLKSSQGGFKTIIIWLPERMHVVFANKILKLLEEPPAQTVFLLVTEAPQLLLETIRSRVQRIDVKRILPEALEKALIERRGMDEATAHQTARIARGDWLRAIETLETGGEREEFFEIFVTMMRIAYRRDPKAMKAWTDGVAKLGREKQRRLLAYFAAQVRENFAFNFADNDIVYLTGEEAAFSRNFARFINERNVQRLLALIDRTSIAIGQNANPKMQFFDFALQTTAMLVRN